MVCKQHTPPIDSIPFCSILGFSTTHFCSLAEQQGTIRSLFANISAKDTSSSSGAKYGC